MKQEINAKEQLKALNLEKKVSQHLLDQMKETNRIHKAILQCIETEGKTVIQIADELKLGKELVFWHINALRKYGKVVDGPKSGDYWKYLKATGDV